MGLIWLLIYIFHTVFLYLHILFKLCNLLAKDKWMITLDSQKTGRVCDLLCAVYLDTNTPAYTFSKYPDKGVKGNAEMYRGERDCKRLIG